MNALTNANADIIASEGKKSINIEMAFIKINFKPGLSVPVDDNGWDKSSDSSSSMFRLVLGCSPSGCIKSETKTKQIY